MESTTDKESVMPTSLFGMAMASAKQFGITPIILIGFMYIVMAVYWPSHEDFMRKQIEQCTQTLTQIGKDIQNLLLKTDQMQKVLDQKGN